ncbi:MAG: ATP-dependent helicase replicase [Clostridia bacterium]|jgi:DNA helicase-2/ATP-dependent DNA helicase PcrA|nr:ATP-dependent helicase replicase [Clostridia bacterium]
MITYDEELKLEQDYLKGVTDFLEQEIKTSETHVGTQKKDLVALRKEMFAEGIPAADDYERHIELAQYQSMEHIESSKYIYQQEKLQKYKKIIEKPYFGRFDFKEQGEDKEPIYVGYQNVMKDDTYEVMVYDWRASIASVFYRSELGMASYTAPNGEIKGEVLLKRQYEIDKRKLKYFFDSSVAITDEILQQALGQNASSHMKNIVETIQKEQDQIIRDKDNDLLIVQGVAGSGKTSIAMHRIAFLLYDRMSEGLSHNNIMIISPNNLFAEYISNVLPALGEQNVLQTTVENIFEACFGHSVRIRQRNSQLEYMIISKYREAIRRTIAFKGSTVFIEVLDRLVTHFEKHLIQFQDIIYDGEVISKKEELKKEFLDNSIQMPIGKRLNRMERIILKKLNTLERIKQKEIQKELQKQGGYEYEEEQEARNRVREYRQQVSDTLRSFIKVDAVGLYRRLFADKALFKQLAKGLELPKDIESILFHTHKVLKGETLPYEDGIALLYLKLKIEGESLYPQIKQVLIDEAQDYYPLHYKVFTEIFKGAQYTVLGDIGQSIEKEAAEAFYDEVVRIVQPKKALKLKLTKSYRSSYEISMFSQRLREGTGVQIAFERHDEVPELVQKSSVNELNKWAADKAHSYQEQGFGTTAIICKSQKQVEEVYREISKRMEIHRVDQKDVTLQKGINIMPVYMAKGLEYDTVIVYDVSAENYYEPADKQLLYIACTRALHRLALGYVGDVSPYFADEV